MGKAHRAPSRPPSPHFYCFRSSTTTTTATTKAVLLFFHVHKNIVVYGQLCANFMGNTNRNIFWCLLCRRNFFFFNFQTESILAICTTRIQEMVSMPAYVLKKIQNLTIGFGIYLMRSRCVAAVFEGVRTGRKVRPPKGPHTWGIWGHASSKKF